MFTTGEGKDSFIYAIVDFRKKIVLHFISSKLLGMGAIGSDPPYVDPMWIKNINFEKEKKSDWVYISNNDHYTIEFFNDMRLSEKA